MIDTVVLLDPTMSRLSVTKPVKVHMYFELEAINQSVLVEPLSNGHF